MQQVGFNWKNIKGCSVTEYKIQFTLTLWQKAVSLKN
jgi:hypothetical protein